MRLPTRKAELYNNSIKKDDPYLTPAAIQRLKDELKDLEKNQRPTMADEVRRTGEMGDLSENAGYQIAKAHLRRINSRILTLTERLKHVIPISNNNDGSGRVRVGSTVTVKTNGQAKTFQILGAHETSPGRGRISHLSPLGVAIMGHKIGECVMVKT